MENLDKLIGDVMAWDWNGIVTLVSVGVIMYLLFSMVVVFLVGFIFWKVFSAMDW